MPFALVRFRTFAPVLALGISLAFAGGCKGEEKSVQSGDGGGLLARGCPSLEVIKSDKDAEGACKLFLLSLGGKHFPKKFSYAQAQVLIRQQNLILDLWKKASSGQIPSDQFKQSLQELDPVCNDIAGEPCGAIFLQ